MIELKPPLTYKQQIDKLRDRGCQVKDPAFCEQVLSQINYYRLSAYFLPFKKKDGNYLSGTDFNNIYQIYEFDRNLRNLLFAAIEEVEIFLRAKLAYFHAHKYGVEGYLDENNYNKRHNHNKFQEKIKNEIQNNKKVLFVQHHIDKYNGRFPIWVITELFTFGMLSYFYNDLPLSDQKQLAREIFNTTPKNLGSWLRCCTDLRNICAHYGRLYFRIFPAIPANLTELDGNAMRRLYGAILSLKEIYPGIEKWNVELYPMIKILINKYRQYIKLEHIGFPCDWEIKLKK